MWDTPRWKIWPLCVFIFVYVHNPAYTVFTCRHVYASTCVPVYLHVFTHSGYMREYDSSFKPLCTLQAENTIKERPESGQTQDELMAY